MKTTAAIDDVVDGDIRFDSAYRQREGSGEAAVQGPDDPELSWDWNNGRWASRPQDQQGDGSRAKSFTGLTCNS